MRCLKRNKQTLWYALYNGQETLYKTDSSGNKIVSYTDESTNPPTIYYEEMGLVDVYKKAEKFTGSLTLSKGNSELADYGVNLADYEAVLITNKNYVPVTETTLIWANKEPKKDKNGYPDPSSADYRVIKCKPSLNEDRYILAKVVK